MGADSSGVMNVPVLLLKTKSIPSDSYEETLSSLRFPKGAIDGKFDPHFLPVLQHRFDDEGISTVRSLLLAQKISGRRDAKYGGIIFTSQRAVEAFSQVIRDDKESEIATDWSHLHKVPIYSVGPATTRALSAVQYQPPLQIFGEHTGNGEALAKYILEHYRQWYPDRDTLPPLLFLVCEQHRDIIPRMLMDLDLAIDKRIQVDEVAVYGTGVMESFPADFGAMLKKTSRALERWVVVFSPTGCDAMLQGLGILDPNSGIIDLNGRDGKTFVVTIGPTTKAHLVNTFAFEPDVCSETPSPDGILQGMINFSSRLGGRAELSTPSTLEE